MKALPVHHSVIHAVSCTQIKQHVLSD